MIKIIIPPKNSTWGVFRNSDKFKTYKHILSFENDTQKEIFISKHLFGQNNLSFKEIIKDEAFSNNTFKQLKSNEATVKVNVDKLNNNPLKLHFTDEDVLNSNFLISLHKIDKEEIYKFWSITKVESLGDKKNYLVHLELDIFFTYDIKDMISDKPLSIDNAHYDRFKKPINNDQKYVPNFDLKSPNATNEIFDKAISEGSFIPTSHNILKYDYSHLYDEKTTKEEKRILDIAFNNMQSVLITSTEPLGEDPFNIEKDNTYQRMTLNSHPTGYYIYDFPFFKDYKDERDNNIVKNFKINVEAGGKNFTIAGMDGFYDNFKDENSKIITMATTITSANSFNNMIGYYDKEKVKFKIRCKIDDDINPKNNKKNVTVTFFNETNDLENINDGRFNFVKIKNLNNNLMVVNPYEIKIFGYKKHENKPNGIVAKWDVWDGDFSNFKPTIGKKANLAHETKSYLSKYSKIKILTMTNNIYEFKREFLIPYNNSNYNKTIMMRKANTFQPELEREIFGVNGNYEQHDPSVDPYSWDKNIYGYDLVENKLWYDNISNYVLPSEHNTFKDYLSKNKAQLNNQVMQNKSRMSNMIYKNDLSLSLFEKFSGITDSAFDFRSSVMSLQNQVNKIEDLKNTPNKLNSNGSKLNGDITLSNLEAKIVYYELQEIVKKQLRTHFLEYGVEYGAKLFNFNKVINSRYYFNFVKAPEVFENIKLVVSEEIKKIINETIANGVTIWHFRDIKTFKGIKNYEYDNVEMSLLDES